MPIVEGVRVIDRIYRVSPARQQEIAEHWRAIERERARKRLARALKPKGQGRKSTDRRGTGAVRVFAVDLPRYELLGDGLSEAEEAEVVRKLWAWIRASGRMPWYRFVEALRIERFGPPPPPERPGLRTDYGDGHLHRTDGW